MKAFSKRELVGVVVILLVIFLASYLNLRVAIRRSRDAQRRADLNAITSALEGYHEAFGYFPPGQDGEILACRGENFDEKLAQLREEEIFDQNKFFEILRPCVRGNDGLTDLFDAGSTPFLKVIPKDPKASEGISYLYFSNSKRFQIYAYLEGGQQEIGYDGAVVARNLLCGNKVCNFGKAYGETPLDKSLEEDENELLEKSK